MEECLNEPIDPEIDPELKKQLDEREASRIAVLKSIVDVYGKPDGYDASHMFNGDHLSPLLAYLTYLSDTEGGEDKHIAVRIPVEGEPTVQFLSESAKHLTLEEANLAEAYRSALEGVIRG